MTIESIVRNRGHQGSGGVACYHCCFVHELVPSHRIVAQMLSRVSVLHGKSEDCL